MTDAPHSTHVCTTCGDHFTVTPPALPGSDWRNCLAWECDSYAPSRDATLFLGDAVRAEC